MWRDLLDLLKSMLKTINEPSYQPDWISWGGNQGTHIFLGMVLSAILGNPMIATMIYLVFKEGRDVFSRGGSLADSLTDSFYFGTGAWVLFAITAGSSAALSLLMAFVFLAIGCIIRAYLDKLTYE